MTRTYVSSTPALTRSISQPLGIGSYTSPVSSTQVYLPPTYSTAPTYVTSTPITSYTQTPITRVIRPSYQADRIIRSSEYTPLTTYSTPVQSYTTPVQSYTTPVQSYTTTAPRQVYTLPSQTYHTAAPTYLSSSPFEVRREPLQSTVVAAPADRVVSSTYTPMKVMTTPTIDLGASRIRSSSHNTIRSSRDGHLIRETNEPAADEELRTSKIVVSKSNVDYYIDENTIRNVRPVTELISNYIPRIDVGRFYQSPPVASVFTTSPHTPVYTTPLLRGSHNVTSSPTPTYVPFSQAVPVSSRPQPVSSQQYFTTPTSGPKYAYPTPIGTSFGRPSNLNVVSGTPRAVEVIPATTVVKRDENDADIKNAAASAQGQQQKEIQANLRPEEKSLPADRQSSDVKPRELDAGQASDSKEPLWNE